MTAYTLTDVLYVTLYTVHVYLPVWGIAGAGVGEGLTEYNMDCVTDCPTEEEDAWECCEGEEDEEAGTEELRSSCEGKSRRRRYW